MISHLVNVCFGYTQLKGSAESSHSGQEPTSSSEDKYQVGETKEETLRVGTNLGYGGFNGVNVEQVLYFVGLQHLKFNVWVILGIIC